MFIKLLEDRKYRGRDYKEGDVIEVQPSLGTNMILNGVGVRVKEEDFEKNTQDLTKLKKDELIPLVLQKDETQTEDELKKLKKEELIALLQ